MVNSNPANPVSPTWQAVCWLAAAADCDVRTARRALADGLDAVRPGRVRDRIARALARADEARP